MKRSITVLVQESLLKKTKKVLHILSQYANNVYIIMIQQHSSRAIYRIYSHNLV